VDENIDKVVPTDVKPSEIIIQGKAETSHRPIKVIWVFAVGKKRSFDIFPGRIAQMEIGIFRDVWYIVKVP